MRPSASRCRLSNPIRLRVSVIVLLPGFMKLKFNAHQRIPILQRVTGSPASRTTRPVTADTVPAVSAAHRAYDFIGTSLATEFPALQRGGVTQRPAQSPQALRDHRALLLSRAVFDKDCSRLHAHIEAKTYLSGCLACASYLGVDKQDCGRIIRLVLCRLMCWDKTRALRSSAYPSQARAIGARS
jgi:hypothetical protein